MADRKKSKSQSSFVNIAVFWFIFLAATLWLTTRSKPFLHSINLDSEEATPSRIYISSALTSFSDRTSCIWISMRDNILRKSSIKLNQRYGLEFKITRKNLHVLLCILLSGDIATNPGPKVSAKNQALRCLSFNAQSLKSTHKRVDGSLTTNLSVFQDLVYTENLDRIAVTETWLNNSVSNNEILPLGYNIIRQDRSSDKREGGVLLALRENIQYNIMEINSESELEIVAVELDTQNTKFLLSVCYRPPNCNLKDWLSSFTYFLQISERYEKVLITGDFNFPDLTWNLLDDKNGCGVTSNYAIDFRELTNDFFLQQVNSFPRRLNNILDLIFTKTPECVSDLSCILPSSVDIFTDHNLLFFDFKVYVTLSSHESRTIFDYNSADWENLYKDLSANFTQSSSLLGSGSNCSSNSKNVDIDVAWQKWSESFINTVSRHIPTKVVKRRGSPPWFDSEIRHLFKRKETARRKAKKSSRPNHWENFRNLRRSLKSLVARKKREFLQSLPNLMKSNPKKFWSVFKSISRTSSVPNKMVWTRDDITTTAEKPTEVANLLNDYFYYMFKVPLSNDEYNNCSTQDEILCEPLSDILVTPDEVDTIIFALDDNKATGPDKIPAKLFAMLCFSDIFFSLRPFQYEPNI